MSSKDYSAVQRRGDGQHATAGTYAPVCQRSTQQPAKTAKTTAAALEVFRRSPLHNIATAAVISSAAAFFQLVTDQRCDAASTTAPTWDVQKLQPSALACLFLQTATDLF